ncbi:MAG: Sfum_1244 family protein [Thermodesulfovibrionales bacterium]
MDLDKIIEQVKYNCNVSDARFWGYYSICGLLLRMRGLYRHEKGLMPWEKIPSDDISFWIGERERLWKELEEQDFQPIDVNGKGLGPFEIEAINRELNERGLVYGGGYSTFGKPAFFLARLKEKKHFYDYNVYYAEKELCRDLSTSIAMLQGICIFMRKEPLELILYEKVEEMRSKRFKSLLDRAFSLYGIEKDSPEKLALYEKIKDISDDISEIFIYHEIGEAVEDRYGIQWQDVAGSDRWLELHLRGIKDLLADTSDYGPLNLIIKRQDERLLLFYLLFLDGIRKTLLPEMMNSFQTFIDSGDWGVLEKARIKGYERARSIIKEIAGLIQDRKDLSSLTQGLKESIEKRLES